MPDTLENIAKPHAPEVKTVPPVDNPSLVGVETVPVVANPEYMNFWFNESDELAMYDPDGQDVRLFHRTGDIFADFTDKVINQGKATTSRYLRKPGRLGSVRHWYHMVGPDNELVGAKDDLVTAATEMITNIDSAKDEFERQQVFTDVMSSFLAASKDTDDWATRTQLRRAAHDTYKRFKEDKSYNWDSEDNGYLVDAEMLYDNMIFEQLIDDYHNKPNQQMRYEDYKKTVIQFHMDSAKRFVLNMEKMTGSGKMYEWFFILGNRNEQILTDEIDRYTTRAALAHEDDFWPPKGFKDIDYELKEDVIVDEYIDGKTIKREKYQLKGSQKDKRTYDPSIHMIYFDKNDIRQTQQKEIMRKGVGAFLAQINASQDERVQLNQDTKKAIDEARELLGF